MADDFILPYKGLYIRFINGMYYTFDDQLKKQPNEAIIGCIADLGHAKRQITLHLKGHYNNDK